MNHRDPVSLHARRTLRISVARSSNARQHKPALCRVTPICQWLVVLILAVAAASPVRADTFPLGLFGDAYVRACGYVNSSVGCVSKEHMFGQPQHADAGNVGEDIAHTSATAQPAQNASFASARAELMTQPNGQLCCGGNAVASTSVLYNVVDAKTGISLAGQEMTLSVKGTATAGPACDNCGNTDGEWSFQILDPATKHSVLSNAA